MSDAAQLADTTEAEVSWTTRFKGTITPALGTPMELLTHGAGCYVWDVNGREYLDFLAGIAVNSLGHAHPVFVEAVSKQAATLAHVSNYFSTPPQLELAERLIRLAGAGAAGRAYFGNSGAEANEAAFKLARLNNSGGTRTRILALTNSFHGRTMGALALTGKPALREPFEPMTPGVEHIDTTIEALETALDDTVAALFVEPIKGEAGVLDLPTGYLERARELTQQHGALLILDEIQTGVGRTGEWFAFQHSSIVPDAITVAKGIAGGFPIGALVTFGWASELFERGQHGSTFGGNPLATATANAVLGEIESAGLAANAVRRGEEFVEIVTAINSPLVAEIRGKGLLRGIGLTTPVANEIVRVALLNGLIVNAPNDSTIRVAPPLIVGDNEMRDFGDRFRRTLETVAAH
jgi:acetylornithine/N-succinyldiaminopimelate aminotransferase